MDFGILGPLEVRDGGRSLDVPRGRARKLLGVLLVHANAPLSTERLLHELWADDRPDTATKALQGYVSQLRKVLGTAALQTVASGYSLVVPPDALDSQRFEQLVARAERAEPAATVELLTDALDLWRGPALADFAYDDFAQAESRRLEDLRLQALEARIEANLALGRHRQVVGELEALLREHPLREQLWGQLMLALYRSGRQADALTAYASAREKLVGELGLEPAQELQDLQRAILTQDAALGAPPRTSRESPAVGAAGPRRRLLRPRTMTVAGALILLAALTVALVEIITGGDDAPRVVPNSVVVVDPKQNSIVADIPAGANPVAVAAGEGGIWVANADDGTVFHIDPKTRKVVKPIGIGGDVSDIAVGFGSVWVANGNENSLVRIDPRQDAVEREISLDGTDLEPQPVFQVAVGGGAVWATSGNRIVKIDPRSNREVRSVPVAGPTSLTYGEGALWAISRSEQLVRIEPHTGRLVTTKPLPGPGSSLVAGGGWLYAIVNLERAQIWRFVPTTLTAAGVVPTDGVPVALELSGNALWAADENGRLSHIDAESEEVVASVALGQQPTAIVAAHGKVWVGVVAPGAR